MEIGIVLSLAASMLFAMTETNNDASPNGRAFNGVWRLSSGEANGKPLSEKQIRGGKMVFHDGHYTVTLPEVGTVTGTQKLSESKGVQTIDIKDESGSHEGKTCLGIYELKGDKLKVVFASPGEARPTKFETAPDSGQWMHVWKRVKAKAAVPQGT